MLDLLQLQGRGSLLLVFNFYVYCISVIYWKYLSSRFNLLDTNRQAFFIALISANSLEREYAIY